MKPDEGLYRSRKIYVLFKISHSSLYWPVLPYIRRIITSAFLFTLVRAASCYLNEMFVAFGY